MSARTGDGRRVRLCLLSQLLVPAIHVVVVAPFHDAAAPAHNRDIPQPFQFTEPVSHLARSLTAFLMRSSTAAIGFCSGLALQ